MRAVSVKTCGREFCIKAYDNEAPRITLVSGKVRVESQHESVTLLPNQQLVADAAGALAVGDADLRPYTFDIPLREWPVDAIKQGGEALCIYIYVA